MEVKNSKTRKKASMRNWIYFSLATLLTVIFSLWTGYYAALIFILLFLDIYITKIVPWGTWKNVKNPQLRSVLDWVDAILFAVIGVGFLNAFFFQNYQIPTSSLEKSLLVGDFLCVSKISYGGRSPMTPLTLPLTQHSIGFLGVKSYLEKPQLEYKRFSGTDTIERNNIVVFNYPSGDTVALKKQDRDYYALCKDNGRANVWANRETYGEIVYRPVDRRENYVKRCVGLPGETIHMSNDSLFINDVYMKGSDNEQHLYYVQTDGTNIASNLFDELGITDDDKMRIRVGDQYLNSIDTAYFTALGLKHEGDNKGLLYSEVFLTKEMIEKLESRKFIWKIVNQNRFVKNINMFSAEKKQYQSQSQVYPITYVSKCEPGDFHKLWIPKKGETIYFDEDVDKKVATYIRCIKNYEKNSFEYRDGIIYINGEKVDSYTFNMDYYFMMGDNRDNSLDSRAWGFVPEDHVVGKPLFVWLSIDKDKSWFSLNKIRWNRLFTSGNKQ